MASTRTLLATGVVPSVAQAADAASVSRATAYRYFPSQEALVAAAHPQIEAASILPPDAPTTLPGRLDAMLDEHFRILLDWEPQLRAALAVALGPTERTLPVRTGRAISWFEDALSPLAESRPELGLRSLAIRLRSACGIESYIWLVDVAGLTTGDALDAMRANAHAIVSDACA